MSADFQEVGSGRASRWKLSGAAFCRSISGVVVIQVVSLRIEDGVRAVYMTLNPDKPARCSAAEID